MNATMNSSNSALVSILIGWIVSKISLGRKLTEYFDESFSESKKGKRK